MRFRAIEASCNPNLLSLWMTRSYLAKLLGNKADASYFCRRCAELAEEFQVIIVCIALHEGVVVG